MKIQDFKDQLAEVLHKWPVAYEGFASGRVTCKLGALCYYSSSVLIDSFVLRKPPERQARNRQAVKKPRFSIH